MSASGKTNEEAMKSTDIPAAVTRRLAEAGHKASQRRDMILKAFFSSREHFTIEELYARARQLDPTIGYTTVWRTLKTLEALGFAHPHTFQDGVARYEHSGAEKHHDHLICLVCGRIQEFMSPKVERLQQEIADEHAFTLVSHRMELYGFCTTCAAQERGRRHA